MAKKPLLNKPDVIAPIRERFEKIADLWNKDRKRYKEDIEFLHGKHWPEKDKTKRDQDGRLTLTVDKLSQYVRQVINDSRQNRPQIKVRPVDSRADIKTADIYDGLLRHIQEQSNADTAFDVALESAVGGGFGFFRLLHEYAGDNTFDQEICFKPIINPLQVYFGEHKEPDGSDCMECFIEESIPKDEFKEQYPNIDVKDWEGSGAKYGDWCGEKVRVVEYYRVVKQSRLLHLLEDGTTATDDDYKNAIANGVLVPAIKESRDIPVNIVKWSKLCGSGYLEEERDTIWKWIPVLPVWGNVQNIDGEVRHVSMINSAKDAQLLYDYSRSAFAERVGQTPEAPWIAAAGQIEQYEEEWDGSRRVRVQRYDPIEINGNALPAPQRQNPSDIPAGFAKDMELSEHDIQGALGMYNASLGRRGNASSGVQEREQARKGDVATFHYHDNLARALRHAGRLCVFAIPKVYDSARIIRALGIDGESKLVELDPKQQESVKTVGPKSIYNLGVGTYDVVVSVGASFQTRRVEAAAEMAGVAQRDPNFLPMYGDIYFKAMDWPLAQELSDRAKLLLPPQIQQAQGDENISPEAAAIKAQAQAAIAQLQQQLQAVGQELAKLQQTEGSKQGELMVKSQEVQIKEKELEIKGKELQIKVAELSIKEKELDLKIYEIQKEQSQLEINADLDWEKEKLHSATSIRTAEISASSNENTTTPQPDNKFPDFAQMLAQALTSPRKRTGKTIRQSDGSYILESIDSPITQ